MALDVTLILPDAHFPYADRPALDVVEEIVKEYKPKRIAILGDWLDACAFSSHPRRSFTDKAAHYLRDEVEPCNDFLDKISRRGREIIFCEGNHEFRVERWARNIGDPGKAAFALLSPERVLRHRVRADGRQGRERRGFHWTPYLGRGVHSHYALAPNLIMVHGWSHAKNAAQTHLAAAKGRSIVHGHTHRFQVASTRDPINGEILQAWSPGCLRDLVPEYSANSPNDWTHGVSLLFQERNRPERWQPYHVSIRDGEAILPGKSI